MGFCRHDVLLHIAAMMVLSTVLSATAEPREETAYRLPATLGIPIPDVPDAGEAACECSIVEDDALWRIAEARTTIVRDIKHTKPPLPSWKPSRRRGLRRAVTTFYSVHSDEAVPVLENKLPPAEVFDELFRCRGFGFTKRIDPRLIETAIEAARHFKSDRIEVISGYRSPKFNDALAKKGRHVATESKHTEGQALDIRIVSAKADEVGKWLFDNFEGGVGTYRANDFVHIDVGPKRRWRGQ